MDSLNGLVEQKLKKLHYFPPSFRVAPPHSIVAAHPLLAGIPKTAFRAEVNTGTNSLQNPSIAQRFPDPIGSAGICPPCFLYFRCTQHLCMPSLAEPGHLKNSKTLSI